MDVRPQLIGSNKIFIQEGDGGKKGAERAPWGKESGITLRQGLLSKHTWVYIVWKLIWSSLEMGLREMMRVLTSLLHQQRTPWTSTALAVRAYTGTPQSYCRFGSRPPQ